jgi:hypothetical protein
VKIGDLVKTRKPLQHPDMVRASSYLVPTSIPEGSLGFVIIDDSTWGSCDYKVYFSCIGKSWWVWKDEIELIKNG